jgi:NAD(P)-dependent dehydrogenase (short-subunit alcohol dehydrogenase family)
VSRRRAPVAAVTGAGRGIGRGIAVALAREGFDLVVNDLAQDEAMAATMDAVAREGRRAACVIGDISDVERSSELAHAFAGAFGAVDCLVNNAGIPAMQRGDLLDMTPESFDRTLAVNLRGTFFLAQAVARLMIEDAREAGDPARSIIFISSLSAVAASVERGEYCIGKAGVSMVNRLFALRLAAHAIACHEVRPGIIRTPMTAPVAEKYDRLIAEGLSPMPRWGEPEDIGRAVAALAGGAFGFTTGDAIHVDGGLHVARL